MSINYYTFSIILSLSLSVKSQMEIDTITIHACDTAFFEIDAKFHPHRLAYIGCTDSLLLKSYLKPDAVDGIYKIYSPIADGYYETGKVINGAKEGEWKRYSSNNRMYARGAYSKDVPVGEHYTYHLNGSIRQIKCYYRYYQVKYEHHYNEKGIEIAPPAYDTTRALYNDERYFVSEEIPYDVRSKVWFNHGRIKKTAPNGYYVIVTPIVDIENYGRIINGKQEGIWRSIDRVSENEMFHRFKNGKLNGSQILLDKNGNTLATSSYKNGKKDGEFIQYYPNGIVKKRAFYQHNRLKSSSYYDENGINTDINFSDE